MPEQRHQVLQGSERKVRFRGGGENYFVLMLGKILWFLCDSLASGRMDDKGQGFIKVHIENQKKYREWKNMTMTSVKLSWSWMEFA